MYLTLIPGRGASPPPPPPPPRPRPRRSRSSPPPRRCRRWSPPTAPRRRGASPLCGRLHPSRRAGSIDQKSSGVSSELSFSSKSPPYTYHVLPLSAVIAFMRGHGAGGAAASPSAAAAASARRRLALRHRRARRRRRLAPAADASPAAAACLRPLAVLVLAVAVAPPPAAVDEQRHLVVVRRGGRAGGRRLRLRLFGLGARRVEGERVPAARLERIGVKVVVELGDEAVAVGRVLVVDAAEEHQPLAVEREGKARAERRRRARALERRPRRRRHVVVPEVLVLDARLRARRSPPGLASRTAASPPSS